jgi:hypothetical protein
VDGRAVTVGSGLRLNGILTSLVEKLQPSFHGRQSTPSIWLSRAENERVLELLSTILDKD